MGVGVENLMIFNIIFQVLQNMNFLPSKLQGILKGLYLCLRYLIPSTKEWQQITQNNTDKIILSFVSSLDIFVIFVQESTR